MDKLIIKTIEGVNGEYDFDIVTMLTEGHAESLTSREGHRIKVMTGLRAGELTDAVSAGDSDVLLAIAAVVLTRNGKQYNDDALWDAPMGAFTFELADRDVEDDAGPPATKLDDGETPPTVELGSNGGESSRPSAAPLPASRPRPTGIRNSPTAATSPLETSET